MSPQRTAVMIALIATAVAGIALSCGGADHAASETLSPGAQVLDDCDRTLEESLPDWPYQRTATGEGVTDCDVCLCVCRKRCGKAGQCDCSRECRKDCRRAL
jgi:hypothetical protein